MSIVRGRPGIGTCDSCSWRSCFYGGSSSGGGKKAPALTLPQARRLIEAVLPVVPYEVAYTLKIIRYYQARNYKAYRSHRQTKLKKLAAQGVNLPD